VLGGGRGQAAQVVDRPELLVDGVMAADVPIAKERSPTTYERVGLLPAYGVMVAGVLGTLVLWFRSRKVAGGVA
jgi:hypothetical protein